MTKLTEPKVGCWFHSWEDSIAGGERTREIHWQGRITRKNRDGSFTVQLYEWMFGEAGDVKRVWPEEMRNWTFYTTNAEMHEAYGEYDTAYWDREEHRES